MLDYLETLDAVVRAGSFAGAARELHKAQSAVSYGVQQLEAKLGVEIFDRSGHRAVLTPAGRAVLEEGRRLMESARRLESLAARTQEGWEPHLRIIIDGIVPQYPIMRALKTIADEGSPTRIEVKVEFLGGVQYRFEEEDGDIMVVNQFADGPRYRSFALSPVESWLVCAREHPLADQTDVTLDMLHEHVELSVHDSTDADSGPDPTAFGGPRVFHLSDFAAKRQALGMGLGFGWMPHYLIEQDLASGALVEVALDGGSRYSFVPRLVYRAASDPGRTARRFIELLREASGEH